MLQIKNDATPLKALLPLQTFKSPSQPLIDHKNLNFIFEYYLLENLAARLLQDDTSSENTYRYELAETCYQKSPTEWHFPLKKNLFWSDGSPLTGEEIRENFLRISREDSRHLKLLKEISRVKYDKHRHTLILGFNIPVYLESLFHELALAEASILHPKNHQDDWSISSGAYFVNTRNPQGLHLKANPYFLLAPKIQNIDIQSGWEFYQLQRSLSNVDFDLIKRPSYSFRDEIRKMDSLVDKVWLGQPTGVYYFRFGKNHPLSMNEQSRKEFSTLVREATKDINQSHFISHNEQMIPQGYSGRLLNFTLKNEHISSLKNQVLVLHFDERMKADLDILINPLIREAKKYHITLEFVFDTEVSESNFAILTNFSGNQKNSLSSWAFLYSTNGSLSAFTPEVSSLLNQAIHTHEEAQTESLQKLHQITLERAFAVPFMSEYSAILTSKKVDLKKINPFDQRLRFYEMAWL